MKARVKATGEIIEINESSTIFDARLCQVYNASELENIPDTDPGYWTRLEHQYAGMAMQGLILTASKHMGTDQEVAQWAKEYAHALVEKMKEERK